MIEVFIAVAEDAESGEFAGHPAGIGVGIFGADGDEGHEAGVDAADDFAGDGDLGVGNALDNGDHERAILI